SWMRPQLSPRAGAAACCARPGRMVARVEQRIRILWGQRHAAAQFRLGMENSRRSGGPVERLAQWNDMAALDLTRRIAHPKDRDADAPMPRLEWLVTNGLGGYAAGKAAGGVTRRYPRFAVRAVA